MSITWLSFIKKNIYRKITKSLFRLVIFIYIDIGLMTVGLTGQDSMFDKKNVIKAAGVNFHFEGC